MALKKRFFALSGEDDAPGAQNDGNGSQKININRKKVLDILQATCAVDHE